MKRSRLGAHTAVRRFRTYFAVCVPAVPFLISPGLQGQQAITLDQAVDLALARSPAYAQAAASVDNARETRRTAIGAFLPDLGLNSGASVRPGSVFDPTTEARLATTNRSFSGGLSLGMDLFTGGRNRSELGRAGVEVQAADAPLAGQHFQVILQTKQFFFGALEQADLFEVAQARVDRAQDSLELVRRQVTAGVATASDSLRARLELANAQQSALQTEAQRRAAQTALGRQIGVSGAVVAVSPAELEPTPLALSDTGIYRTAELNSPDVRAAELAAGADQASATSARAAYLPAVRIYSGYNWSNSDWGFGGGEGAWNGLSLSLSYSVFNGFARESSVARADNQLRVSRLQENDTRLRAREDEDAALFAIRTSQLAVEIAEEAVVVAEEDLRVVLQRLEVGVSTVFEVVTSQVALMEAEASRVTTRYDYLIARAQLEAILGEEL